MRRRASSPTANPPPSVQTPRNLRCFVAFPFFDLVDQDGSTWPKIGPKMGASWPNIAPRWPNMARKLGPHSPKMGLHGPRWAYIARRRANIAASWANLAPRCAYYTPCGWATSTTTAADPTNTRNLRCFFGFPIFSIFPILLYNLFMILYAQVGPWPAVGRKP